MCRQLQIIGRKKRFELEKRRKMNRIEKRMNLLKERKEKAFITYMTAGLPDIEGTKALIRAQEEAGVDALDLGIPFSDPVADGPVIQDASYKSICLGTNLKKVFLMMEEIRNEGVEIPVAFMLYYNTILSCGVETFAAACKKAGVDGVIVPDLPMEEQEELLCALERENSAVLIQTVSLASEGRIPEILKRARGFVRCVFQTYADGQREMFSAKERECLKAVKTASNLPVMVDAGIRKPKDAALVPDLIDGVIEGTYLVQLLKENQYSADAAKAYCSDFKKMVS